VTLDSAGVGAGVSDGVGITAAVTGNWRLIKGAEIVGRAEAASGCERFASKSHRKLALWVKNPQPFEGLLKALLVPLNRSHRLKHELRDSQMNFQAFTARILEFSKQISDLIKESSATAIATCRPERIYRDILQNNNREPNVRRHSLETIVWRRADLCYFFYCP
jgi:hypothetical protein